MKTIKKISTLIVITLVFIGVSQCSSIQKLEVKLPSTIDKVYFQNWVGGQEGSGYGFYFYVECKDNSLSLDSVYFQKHVLKLNKKSVESNTYIGRYKTKQYNDPDMVMTNEPYGEYGNKLPKKIQPLLFELSGNDCVISYKVRQKTKYFKIVNVEQKELIAYPSPPQNKQ